MAAGRTMLVWLTLTVACAYNGYYRPTGERVPACEYYGPYGPRSSYYYAPGYDYGRPSGPNDNPLFYGGGPAPPSGSCPR